MIKVVLADDHVLVRDGIKALLEDQKGITVIDEASNGIEALEVINLLSEQDILAIIKSHDTGGKS